MSFLFVKLAKENNRFVFTEFTTTLLKILDNIIKAPDNPKYRKLRLGNDVVCGSILLAEGATECLTYIGFELTDDAFVMPQTVAISKLQTVRSELNQFRISYMSKPPVDLSTAKITTTKFSIFSHQIRSQLNHVLQYEKDALQVAARCRMPLEELRRRRETKKRNDGDDFVEEFALLYEMMKWFMKEFFHWLESPSCANCNGHSATFQGYSTNPRNFVLTDIVEVFRCNNCSERLLFPRHKNPAVLLKTRSGKRREWTICFTLMCRALGYDARLVSADTTDQVWTEVYSTSQKRWIHCDVSEDYIDASLVYELNQYKKFSYVIAFSKDEVQDVTWRYTVNFAEVLSRRKLCSEKALLKLMFDLREKLQTSLPTERKRYLLERCVAECVEFLTPPHTDKQYGGRIPGSLAWRLSRQEFSLSVLSYTWSPNKTEVERKRFRIRYSTAKDEYHRVETNEIIGDWANGIWDAMYVLRNIEDDSEMCYLCREENNSTGLVKWSFCVKETGLAIDKILIRYHCATFETGSVKIMVSNADICSALDPKKNVFETETFRGSYQLFLTAIMSGGNGEDAWQKAQLFRQSIKDDEFLFELDVTLYEDPNNQPTTDMEGVSCSPHNPLKRAISN